MIAFKTRLAALTLLLGAAAMPALADSSASSSASESISTSVGSISDSFKKSSNSSSKTDVAEGDYKIIDVAAVADRPGIARMTLHAVVEHGEDSEFFLFVPQQVVDMNRLAAGQTVTAQNRPYGVQFANGQPRQAFFLVLADDWYRELQTRPVVL